MSPVTITAQGTSTIFRQAERAVVHVNVSSDGTSQERVSKDVTSTANELRAMLKDLSPKTEKGEAAPDAPVTYWKNNTLSTSSYRPQDDKGKKLDRQYTARSSFEIKVRDFERLGSLATSLSTMPHVEISHIEWRLTDETKASLASQSRQEAVKDAVVKAKDYATVLGRGKPEAFEVIDGSGGGGGGAYRAFPGAHSRMAAHGGGYPRQQQGEILDFQPESVQLNSTVTVKFVAD